MATVQLLDQPTIVNNATGQRTVENIVSSLVSLRRGGMQPSSRSRTEMFGEDAPVWRFLDQFGGPANPLSAACSTGVMETYAVLTMIARGWTLPDPTGRPTGRLPNYNPKVQRNFSIHDWQHVCGSVLGEFSKRGLTWIARWIEDLRQKAAPRKRDQDGLDSCICLLVALHLAEGKKCLMVGDLQSGYIVVPHDSQLCTELGDRCRKTGRNPKEWVRSAQWPLTSA